MRSGQKGQKKRQSLTLGNPMTTLNSLVTNTKNLLIEKSKKGRKRETKNKGRAFRSDLLPFGASWSQKLSVFDSFAFQITK